ncbi:hypothetical protein [Burkholderia sp. Ap-962]|uniref:hypothetical protein n=1 Tax=Burkholderia sp. Ap-962 TaxID=2608333 RepID=UPI00141DF0AD|nr:hypothetical protein [Burkholderia sp. Ap-962]
MDTFTTTDLARYRRTTMSDLALHVKRLMNDPSYGRCLAPDFRRECLGACAGRLIAGEYALGEAPPLPGA